MLVHFLVPGHIYVAAEGSPFPLLVDTIKALCDSCMYLCILFGFPVCCSCCCWFLSMRNSNMPSENLVPVQWHAAPGVKACNTRASSASSTWSACSVSAPVSACRREPLSIPFLFSPSTASYIIVCAPRVQIKVARAQGAKQPQNTAGRALTASRPPCQIMQIIQSINLCQPKKPQWLYNDRCVRCCSKNSPAEKNNAGRACSALRIDLVPRQAWHGFQAAAEYIYIYTYTYTYTYYIGLSETAAR